MRALGIAHLAPFAFRNLGDRYGRISSHDHALQLVHRVHHERVYREISRALNKAHREFFEGPAGDGRGFFMFANQPTPARRSLREKEAGSCGSILDPISHTTW